MKLIPKIIIALTKLEEKRIATIGGEKPKSIYCHRNGKGEVVGLLFMNEDEGFEQLTINGNPPFTTDGTVVGNREPLSI